MSRATTAAAHPTAGRAVPAPRTASRGRHRAGRAGGVRATDLAAVRERMQFGRRPVPHTNAFVRWLLAGSPSGRHTWSSLAAAGGRPRTAFAIILSL
jgi:hypothetical protein